MAGNNVRVGVQTTGVGKASSDLDKFRDKFAQIQKQGGKGFAIGAGAAVTAKGLSILDSALSGALDTAKEWTQAASNLEQSVGAVDSVFGRSSVKIAQFGQTAADAFGLSKREVNELGAVLGAQLQGMGFAADEAAEATINLEKRAADMAATFGGPTSEAVQAISALMRGERDPIERYGVSIKAADIQSRILAKGLDTSTTAARKNSEAVAGLELLMEATAKTQGQFAREAEGAAGSSARLNAELENMHAEIGEELLPLQVAITEAQRDAIPVIKDLAQGFAYSVDSIGDVIDAFVITDGKVRDFTKTSEHLRPALEESGKSLDDFAVAATDTARAHGAAADDVGSAWATAAGATGAAIEDIVDEIDDSRSAVDSAVAGLVDEIENGLDPAAEKARLLRIGRQIADELQSSNPTVRAKAELVRQAVNERLSQLQKDAYVSGSNITSGFAGGLASQIPRVEKAAYNVAKAASKYIKASSPTEAGPFSEMGGPEGQGKHLAELWAKGLEEHLPNLDQALRVPGSPVGSGALGAGGTGSSGGGYGGGMTFAPTVVIQGVATPATVAAIVNDLGPAFADYMTRSGWVPR